MKMFQEVQKPNQWWLFLIILSVQIMLLIDISEKTSAFKSVQNPYEVIMEVAIILFLSIIYFINLRTRIDPIGISAQFGKGKIFYRKYEWKEISECYVRKYKPILEYGGWGIRGFGRPSAYNISGNYGIQIITHSQERFLIGTQKPKQVKEILKNYQHEMKILRKEE